MADNNKYTLRKFFVILIWILLGSGTVVLLIAAITKKDNERLTGIEIHISGVQNHYFISKKDVMDLLENVNKKKLDNAVVSHLDLAAMEKKLERDQWVKKAEIFFDNNNVLQVKISEREPVARIFTTSGNSFYIDTSLARLPLSDKFSARLPVFTGFPTDVKVLKKQDSLLLRDISLMSEYIGFHSFWMAQIEQMDITPRNTFVLVPKLGNQTILFGNADNLEAKFNKLLTFYTQVQTNVGWNKYSVIDVQYRNQVVATRRDAGEIRADSLRSVQIMKDIIAAAKKSIDDSTKIQLPQRDDGNDKINISPSRNNVGSDDLKINTDDKKINKEEFKPAVKEVSDDKEKKSLEKESINDKKVNESVPDSERVPKAVMPSRSDY